MKFTIPILALFSCAVSAQSAVFTSDGNIFDSGTLVGTFSSTFTTVNTDPNPAATFGTTGIQYTFVGLNGNNAQAVADSNIGVGFTITPAAGFVLDSVTVFQSATGLGGVNGGFDLDQTTGRSINPGLLTPTYTIAGFGGTDFVSFVGSAGSNDIGTTDESYLTQITTPTTVGSDITFDQIPVQLLNADSDWFVTLNDVNSAGDTVDFSSFLGNTFANDVLSFDAGFSPVPEPSSALLLGFGGLALLRRRNR